MTLRNLSIKTQILAAFALLVLPLMYLAYFMSTTQSSLTDTMDRLFEEERVLSLATRLQRDLIDVQRNILLYKDTASAGVDKNIMRLFNDLEEALVEISELNRETKESFIVAIKHHLDTFRASYAIVVDYRKRRKELLQSHINNTVLESAKGLPSSSTNNEVRLQLETYLSVAHSHSLTYLVTYDSSEIDAFKRELGIARDLVKHNQDYFIGEVSEDAIRSYEADFLYIVQLTRNYIYLVNVVMAGAAREIRYHSEQLLDITMSYNEEQSQAVTLRLQKVRFWTFVLSLLAIIAVILVSFYFFRLIVRPIEAITEVFNELIKGRSIDAIPGSEDSNEIGMLARAANVLKARNQQTVELLAETEKAVDIEQALNAELSNAKERSEKALSVKSDFLANMSHELRTPLNSIIGYTVRLLKSPEQLHERQINALGVIERNGKHLLNLINDILDLSKLEANKLEVSFSRVDVCELCSDIVEQMMPEAGNKALEVHQVRSHSQWMIDTDPIRLSQIVMNLLSNAIKYTEQGWIRLELEINEEKNLLKISIADSGKGIDEEDLDLLFERFEQISETKPVRIGEGKGLGLPIVKSLVALLEGSVEVDSRKGRGSTFTVRFPLNR